MTARRAVLVGGGAALLGGARGTVAAPHWRPEPAQRPAKRQLIAMSDGTRLDCWDTGGSGETVVLMHPATGSADVWGYQQPVLVDANYRVVAYSRRGVGRSDAGPQPATATAVDDLATLLDALGIATCHLVGSAAGAFIVPDAALAMSGRLRSLTIACSHAGIVENSWRADQAVLIPPNFRELPSDFRELSGSYRLDNPTGRARWLELEHQAATKRIVQPPRNRVDYAALSRIDRPTLVITGDADLYLPPARARKLAGLIPGASLAVIAEAAHSVYWEQPDEFNAVLLRFLRRSSGAPS